MEIKNGTNRFYIGETEKDPDAEIVFKYRRSNLIVIERTFVSEALRGQKIAAKLLEKVVSTAREKRFKIIPKCSYAEKVMNRGDEYKDVLYKEDGDNSPKHLC